MAGTDVMYLGACLIHGIEKMVELTAWQSKDGMDAVVKQAVE